MDNCKRFAYVVRKRLLKKARIANPRQLENFVAEQAELSREMLISKPRDAELLAKRCASLDKEMSISRKL